MKKLITAFALCNLIAGAAIADTITTKDGSTINGTIEEVDSISISIKTEFGLVIAIDQTQIESFTTDNPKFVSTEGGDGQKGKLITGNEVEAAPKAAPTVTGAPPARKSDWAHEATFDYTGKSGNSSATGMAGSYRATRAKEDNKLEFYTAINFQDTDGVKSADDLKFGGQYTNNISEKYFWYVRSEFGQDAIKAIDLYGNASYGYGKSLLNTETRTLDIRAGLGYRYETYDDTTTRADVSSASLDIGLTHNESFKWGDIVNRITLTPSVDDFSSIRVVHDTNLQLPLKAEGWTLRFGISTDYDSEADLSNKDKLDITYYTRLALKWK